MHPTTKISILSILVIAIFIVCPTAAHAEHEHQDWTLHLDEIQAAFAEQYTELNLFEKALFNSIIEEELGEDPMIAEEAREHLTEITKRLGYGDDYNELTTEQKGEVIFFMSTSEEIKEGHKLSESDQERYDRLVAEMPENFLKNPKLIIPVLGALLSGIVIAIVIRRRRQ